nr:RNA-binding S4 domain-containing protein [Lysinibacillus timonensis]
MRLDKYLKVSRLIKRRTLAKEVAEQGRITINGKAAKASTTVKINDELAIRFGQKVVTARVDDIRENVRKEEAAKMFTILKEEKLEKVELQFIDDED